MRSLWFKLSVYFTLITLGCVIMFTVGFNVMYANTVHANTVTPEAVRTIAANEQAFFVQALQQNDASIWMELAGQNLLQKLSNMRLKDEESFNITAIVEPETYIRIADPAGKIVYSNAEAFPDRIKAIFAAQKESVAVAKSLERKDHIWVALPLKDKEGIVQGTLSILFMAEFDSNKLIADMLMGYLSDLWGSLLACGVIALACSMVANRFVTGPLTRIGKVTEEWCKGNFALRIKVKAKGGDILAEHSRRLNFMADELENLLVLKEQAAVTKERNWMAGELHDTVKQNLFALSLQLAVIKHKNTAAGIAEYIDEAGRIVRESQQDIKAILTHFHLVEQEETSLIQRLDILAEDTYRRYGVTVLWDKKEVPAVSKPQEHILFRMTQEAMSNSIRHGKATRIILNLFRQDGSLFWNVADNGSGLPEGWELCINSGLGLTFMHKRIQEMPEGKFAVSARSEGGTLVSAQWREFI